MADWQSLNAPAGPLTNTINPPVAVATNQDGTLEVFVTGGDGALWHIKQEGVRGGWPGSWVSLGKPSTDPARALISQGPLAVGRNQDGRLEAFVADISGGLWHNWEYPSPSSPWLGWNFLGQVPNGAVDSLAVGINSDGRLELFTVSPNSGAGHTWQWPTAGAGWPGGWVPLTGFPPPASAAAVSLTPAVVALDSASQLEVFLTRSDPAFANGVQIWTNRQIGPGGGWTGWQSLWSPPPALGNYSAPVVGVNQNGTLEIFVGCFDGNVWHRWQEAGTQFWFPDWVSLGAPTGKPQPNQTLPSPAVPCWPATPPPPFSLPNLDGRLEIFAEGLDGALWHNWQQKPNTQQWNGWVSLGVPPGNSAVSARSAVAVNGGLIFPPNLLPGALEVFLVAGGKLWHVWQQTPGGGWG